MQMTHNDDVESNSLSSPPIFREALRTWIYVAVNSFGGPAGQIAVMHRVLVDEKKWISEERFLHALNYCMLLPGPEAQQLAIYIGWLFHGVRGGVTAGTLFVLPGILAILALSYLYAGFHQIDAIQALFFGLKSAVLAIVLEAVLRIGKRALKTRTHIGLAIAAFIAIFFLDIPFPLVVIGAGVFGLATTYAKGKDAGLSQPAPQSSAIRRSAVVRSLQVAAICLCLWFAPLIAVGFAPSQDAIYFKVGVFFSKAAVVTFGGAYSVLAYIAQEAVHTYGWLKPGEMVDGLAMAETTPGPLIMVVQFVGFMAAFRNPGALPPMLAGTLASLLTTWVTFAPCFLWIFLGAPYIESLRGNTKLNGALSAITAAVVGVVLNLAVWFTLHTLFRQIDEVSVAGIRLFIPQWTTINWAALFLAVAAVVATFRYHVSMFKVLGACALAGIVVQLIAK